MKSVSGKSFVLPKGFIFKAFYSHPEVRLKVVDYVYDIKTSASSKQTKRVHSGYRVENLSLTPERSPKLSVGLREKLRIFDIGLQPMADMIKKGAYVNEDGSSISAGVQGVV